MISKAVVEFRVQDSYRGEFGFDWMRIDDQVIPLFEIPYYPVLETGYGLEKDKNPLVQKNEAYKQMREPKKRLKDIYRNITNTHPELDENGIRLVKEQSKLKQVGGFLKKHQVWLVLA